MPLHDRFERFSSPPLFKTPPPYTHDKRQSYYDYTTELNVIGFSG
jgi:hypothetical protein